MKKIGLIFVSIHICVFVHLNINAESSIYNKIKKSSLLKLNKFKKQRKYCNNSIQFYSPIQTCTLVSTHLANIRSIFNDPDIDMQWYFGRKNSSCFHLSHDLNRLWNLGILGSGVKIALIGGGVDIEHEDLNDNYLSYISYNLINDSFVIQPSQKNEPTEVAGLISAVSNNRKCGVGAAPLSKFSNLQISHEEGELLSSSLLSKAILYKVWTIDIYILSFHVNYEINNRKFQRISIYRSLKIGYKNGRSGLGSIFVMGSGNRGTMGENCGFNGIVQMYEVLAFGTISYSGSSFITSEKCNAILAASLGTEYKISYDRMYSTSNSNSCGESATGSYASSAISAGILALLISAHPLLTPRQIIILIVLSSIQYDLTSISNAHHFYYSYSFGFGMINAIGLIELASHGYIYYIGEEHICLTNIFLTAVVVKRNTQEVLYIYTSGCLESIYCVTELEHVFISFTISAQVRNAIKIYLTSPSGTRFAILWPRYSDNKKNGFNNWRLKLMGYFGENPLGVWKLEILSTIATSKIYKVELKFHGTCKNPRSNIISHNNINYYIFTYVSNSSDFFNVSEHAQSIYPDEDQYQRDKFSFIKTDFTHFHNINMLR